MFDNKLLMDCPDVPRVLNGLKPFQRCSVDYVFERLYGPNHTRRFLLADEVGLGKTMVARGVIAKTIEHLWDKVDRVDVVYICSNQDIARQNIARLNVTGQDDFALASRITLLPIRSGDGAMHPRLNFVSFTPGTSFDLKSSLGVSTERVLLYHLLKDAWNLNGTAPINVLQGGSTSDSFRRQVKNFHNECTLDEPLAAAFRQEASKDSALRDEFGELCEVFHRAGATISDEAWRRRSDLVGRLRALLARTCLQSLQPDLIILDEFQRFKDLLSRESEAGDLAHDLFHYSDDHSEARVLLLSATPYKMYTMGHEREQEDHYSDFLRTLRFLLQDDQAFERVGHLLREYRRLLYRLAEDSAALAVVRDELQASLKRVICRTERLAVTADRDGMLREVACLPRLESGDVAAYVALQRVAKALDKPDTLEYWKSAPYLLSYMEEYTLKQSLRDRAGESDVYEALRQGGDAAGLTLPGVSMRAYQPIEAMNPRMRALAEQTVDTEAWQALWVPPSLSYYELAGPFAAMAKIGFTKRLVFSSWQVVPKAIATLLSYAAERKMMTAFDPTAVNSPEARKAHGPLLNFNRSEGRLGGMPVLGLLYPSIYLAEKFDPLRLMAEQPPGERLTVYEAVGLVETALTSELAELTVLAPSQGPIDEAWYWAAPILLDRRHAPGVTNKWWSNEDLAHAWSSGEQEQSTTESDGESVWSLHVAEARRLVSGDLTLGRPPEDLAHIVAKLALGGPAVVALRALTRVSGGQAMLNDPECRHAAGRVAWAFRSLFNAAEVMALLRSNGANEAYWRGVLSYCVEGCLQASLDEYAHVLREWLGAGDAEPTQTAQKVSTAIIEAVTIRVASPGVDQIRLNDRQRTVEIENHRIRARFAMRYGDEKAEDGKTTISRADQVRRAFNSPFWPFVLATTSVGQEGLDFHTYCHAVVHWNLPSNPVDLEQREGRVHRFKGHAVRRNVAVVYGKQLCDATVDDPWERMFELASAEHGDASGGLIPFWVFAPEGGVKIERHVSSLPLSTEATYLPLLRQSLAIYRMVFGQPRQDDLVAYLADKFGTETDSGMFKFGIDLSPQTA